MGWLIDLVSSFLGVVNDLVSFMSSPLNDTLEKLDFNFLGIDITIPYIGDMSPLMLVGSGLIVFILISIGLRLLHG